jgi:hypothetical protein
VDDLNGLDMVTVHELSAASGLAPAAVLGAARAAGLIVAVWVEGVDVLWWSHPTSAKYVIGNRAGPPSYCAVVEGQAENLERDFRGYVKVDEAVLAKFEKFGSGYADGFTGWAGLLGVEDRGRTQGHFVDADCHAKNVLQGQSSEHWTGGHVLHLTPQNLCLPRAVAAKLFSVGADARDNAYANDAAPAVVVSIPPPARPETPRVNEKLDEKVTNALLCAVQDAIETASKLREDVYECIPDYGPLMSLGEVTLPAAPSILELIQALCNIWTAIVDVHARANRKLPKGRKLANVPDLADQLVKTKGVSATKVAEFVADVMANCGRARGHSAHALRPVITAALRGQNIEVDKIR